MKKFESTATIAKIENPCSDSHYLTFKRWEKGDKKRIYINDYKRRTLGYIDMITGEVNISDRQGNMQAEIDFALGFFKAEYEF